MSATQESQQAVCKEATIFKSDKMAENGGADDFEDSKDGSPETTNFSFLLLEPSDMMGTQAQQAVSDETSVFKSQEMIENCAPDDYQTCKDMLPSSSRLLPLSTRDLSFGDFARLENKGVAEALSQRADPVEHKCSSSFASLQLVEPKQKERRPGLIGQRPFFSDFSDPDIKPQPQGLEGFIKDHTPRQLASQKPATNEEPNVKSLSLPEIFSGCTYATDGRTLDVQLVSDQTHVFRVPCKTFDRTCNVRLLSGGTVVYDELSRHLSIPNLYERGPPIVVMDLPSHHQEDRSAEVQNSQVCQRVFNRSLSCGNAVHDGRQSFTDLCAQVPDHNKADIVDWKRAETPESSQVGNFVWSLCDKTEIYDEFQPLPFSKPYAQGPLITTTDGPDDDQKGFVNGTQVQNSKTCQRAAGTSLPANSSPPTNVTSDRLNNEEDFVADIREVENRQTFHQPIFCRSLSDSTGSSHIVTTDRLNNDQVNYAQGTRFQNSHTSHQRIFFRSLSGGDCILESSKRKVSLPDLFPDGPRPEQFRPSAWRYLAGGRLTNVEIPNVCTELDEVTEGRTVPRT